MAESVKCSAASMDRRGGSFLPLLVDWKERTTGFAFYQGCRQQDLGNTPSLKPDLFDRHLGQLASDLGRFHTDAGQRLQSSQTVLVIEANQAYITGDIEPRLQKSFSDAVGNIVVAGQHRGDGMLLL